jgi:serine/threonine protein kinase
MSRTLRATLEDGRTIEYLAEVVGEGSMKTVHFTPDRKSVVCFFKDKSASHDPERRRRLQAIVGRYNPTTDGATGAYWRDLFCWPTGVVTSPELGVVAPAYAANFFFRSGPFAGKEKQATWFTSPKLRRLIPEEERGSFLSYLQISILVARALRRMHAAGLAHSDLSNRNVLVDPKGGRAAIIDIDSLVVPQMFPPDVLGTPGYIAPEVLGTQHLALGSAGRTLPSRTTDQHALAVLLYEYLLGRHPLRGPKVNSTVSAEEDERLSMGSMAVWIESPTDPSNRPKGDFLPYTTLGPYLAPLFERAFGDGLRSPQARPGADEWERALVRTTDLLMRCGSPGCTYQWFVYDGSTTPRCPGCGWRFRGTMPVLNFYREGKPGQYISDRHRLVVWQNQYLYRWHIYSNQFAGEGADRAPLGYFTFHNDQWLLVNQNGDSMQVVGGDPVPTGSPLVLRDGLQIRLSRESAGRMAVVQMVTA